VPSTIVGLHSTANLVLQTIISLHTSQPLHLSLLLPYHPPSTLYFPAGDKRHPSDNVQTSPASPFRIPPPKHRVTFDPFRRRNGPVPGQRAGSQNHDSGTVVVRRLLGVHTPTSPGVDFRDERQHDVSLKFSHRRPQSTHPTEPQYKTSRRSDHTRSPLRIP
jgi:hypothetical protein